jgi:hypothetical protein
MSFSNRPLLLVICALLGAQQSARAYDVETHEVMVRAAIAGSILDAALEDLGLKGRDNELQRFPNSDSTPNTITRLIVDGTRIEDNVSYNPFTFEFRVRHHFYNPRTGLGAPTANTYRSPEWALAPRGEIGIQQFSYWDARQHFFDGLTKATESDRGAALGRAFQRLGHVVHHLQDMTQPQHVRNDVHCSAWACNLIGIRPAPSHYESWTNRPAVRDSLPTDPASAGYDVASEQFRNTFKSPRHFWNTLGPSFLNDDSPRLGMGIAEFTNRNFVSAGTNYTGTFPQFQPNANFTLPVPLAVRREGVAVFNEKTQQTMSGEMWFIPNVVQDNFLGTTDTNLYGSTFSVFDAELTNIGREPVLSLNRINFQAAHAYLIPRAVGFSAGMINYFFRGKIDLKKDEQDPDIFRVVNLGPEKMTGKFALYYDALDGNRYPVLANPPNADPADQFAWRLEVDKLNPATPNSNLSSPISFARPPGNGPLSAKTPNEYLLVFSGDMGEERAGTNMIGAVAAKMISAPYNSALYLVGADASNQRILLRADKSGTRVVGPSEFHPLRGMGLLYPNQQALDKGYTHKQTKFTQHAFGFSYETQAITVGQHLPFYGLFTTGWVKNSATGAFEAVSGPAWTARSPDPLVGEFRFRAIVPESNYMIGQLEYRRIWKDATGVQQTATGTIPLPPLPYSGGMSYGAFPQGLVYIAPDGLSVAGFWSATSNPTPPVYTTTVEDFEMRIALGEAPTLSFVSTGTRVIDVLTQQITPSTTAVVGQVSVTEPGCGPPPNTFTSELRKTEFLNRIDHQISEKFYIGYLNGALRTYGHAENILTTVSSTDTSGIVASCDRVHSETRGESVNKMVVDGGYQFDVGNLPITIRQNDAGNGPQPLNRTWDYLYDGPKPPPAVTYTSTAFTPSTTLHHVWRPLTERANDAVFQRAVTGAPTKNMFRDREIGDKAYVADASPIGEVFFATADLSVIVHEPKRGPTLTLPPNVVKLIAAIWM